MLVWNKKKAVLYHCFPYNIMLLLVLHHRWNQQVKHNRIRLESEVWHINVVLTPQISLG